MHPQERRAGILHTHHIRRACALKRLVAHGELDQPSPQGTVDARRLVHHPDDAACGVDVHTHKRVLERHERRRRRRRRRGSAIVTAAGRVTGAPGALSRALAVHLDMADRGRCASSTRARAPLSKIGAADSVPNG